MGRVDAVGLFGAAQVARARRYHRPLYAAAVGGLVLDLLLLALIVFSPLGGLLFEPVEGWPWWAQVVGFTGIVVASTTAIVLPLAFWTGFVHERRWGFSTQDLRGFAADRAKAFALGLVLSGAALLGLVGSARLLPRLWPLAACLAGAAVVLALGVLAPLLIEPLFNRFGPLQDAGLAAELQALAEKARLPLKEVLVADASRRTRKSNAYVSGLGPTRRLVLYDTLLGANTPIRDRPRARTRARPPPRPPPDQGDAARHGRPRLVRARPLGGPALADRARRHRGARRCRRPRGGAVRLPARCNAADPRCAARRRALASVGARGRPLLAGADRRPRHVRGHPPLTRDREPLRPRPTAPDLPRVLQPPHRCRADPSRARRGAV